AGWRSAAGGTWRAGEYPRRCAIRRRRRKSPEGQGSGTRRACEWLLHAAAFPALVPAPSIVRKLPPNLLDLQNYRHDQRTPCRSFYDEALQVSADLFFNDTDVGFFFRRGGVERIGDETAGVAHEAVFGAGGEAAHHDLRNRLHGAGQLVDG